MNPRESISARVAVSHREGGRRRFVATSIAAVFALAVVMPAALWAKAPTKDVTITVTVGGPQTPQPLNASHFLVTDNGQLQNVDVVAGPDHNAPLHVAVVLEEGIASSINNQISSLRGFVNQLPPGSNVMVAMINRNQASTVVPFTTDLKRAAQAIPMVMNYRDEVPLNAFVSLSEVIKQFDGIEGRKEIVMIGSGFDVLQDSMTPSYNMDLQRAEEAARRANVVVHTIWVPAAGFHSERMNMLGASNLLDLADATGGQSFWNVDRFVVQDLTPRLQTVAETFSRQYILRFSPDFASRAAHRIKVTLKNVPDAKAMKLSYPVR